MIYMWLSAFGFAWEQGEGKCREGLLETAVVRGRVSEKADRCPS